MTQQKGVSCMPVMKFFRQIGVFWREVTILCFQSVGNISSFREVDTALVIA